MDRQRFVAGALIALAVLAVRPAQAGSGEPAPRPTHQDRRRLIRAHPRPPELLPRPQPLSGQDDFDVTSYDLSINIDTSNKRIDGTCAIAFKAAAGVASVSELVLDLDPSMLVTGSILRRGSTAALVYTHVGAELRIRLDPPVNAGQSDTVSVRYSGRPRQDDGVGFQFSTYASAPILSPSVFTLSEPYRARTWWPCKDRPDDKATVLLRIETRNNLTVVANGALFSILPSTRDRRIVTTWRETRPIATYLVALAAGIYESCSEPYQSRINPAMSFPITTWAFADKIADACADLGVAREQMPFFEESFGIYPFATEKYGQVIVQPRNGQDPYVAMENQTLSTFGTLWLRLNSDIVSAHELSHHWFGNSVGPRDFGSIWLNEGFATYAEALWYEESARQAGRPALDDLTAYMRDLDPLTSLGEFQGPVDDPLDLDADGWPDGDADGAVLTVYWKGAWVLHMLRWVLAQPSADVSAANLMTILQAHAREHGHGVVSTEEFVAMANEVAARQLGRSGGLAWFFDQWLHREGRPCYRVGFSSAQQGPGTWQSFIEVEQRAVEVDGDTGALVCTGVLAAPYVMPVELTLRMADGGVVRQVVDNHDPRQRYVFSSASPLSGVGWDEGEWILKHVQAMDIDLDDDGWPDDLDGCPLVPNPQQEDLNSDGQQDACQPGLDFDQDRVPNEADCAPADPGAWTALDPLTRPDLDSELRVSEGGTGSIVLRFTIPLAAGAERPYAADLVEGRLERLRINRSTRDAACLVAGTLETEIERPAAAVPGSRYFLVYPFNGCGQVDPAGLPLSACR